MHDLRFTCNYLFYYRWYLNRKIKKAKQAEKDADSVNMNLSDILIFDTETTGIFPNSEEILELAIINASNLKRKRHGRKRKQ